MDTLNLTYDEVVNQIPYRNLLVMRRDKPRVCYGVKVVRGELTGRDKLAQFRERKKNGGG